MTTNNELVQNILDYIEENLNEKISLDVIADNFAYSKYHLHRIFSLATGFTLKTYVLRRKLTNAANELIRTNSGIIDIALGAGYNSQAAFTEAFKKHFKLSPASYRKKGEFSPMQLKYELREDKIINDKIMDIEIKNIDKIVAIGYHENTKNGASIFPKVHKKLNKKYNKIKYKTEEGFYLGINNYELFREKEDEISEFDYYASAVVSSVEEIPKGMTVTTLPPSKYLVFSYKGKAEDSMESTVNFIYKKWFPASTHIFNENNMYDFIKYSYQTDSNGLNSIQYYIPIIK